MINRDVLSLLLKTFYDFLIRHFNKTSAVAEMGDRGHHRQGRKKAGCYAPFAGAGTPSNIMWPGPRSILPYEVAS